jgi:hypothetical protein
VRIHEFDRRIAFEWHLRSPVVVVSVWSDMAHTCFRHVSSMMAQSLRTPVFAGPGA